MVELILWKDRKIDKLRRDMDRIFNRVTSDFGFDPFPGIAKKSPTAVLYEEGDNLILKAEIPEMDPENMDISLSHDTLTINSEAKYESVKNQNGINRRERGYRSFSRTFKLPCRVLMDDVKAEYEKGILKIVMPKCSEQKIKKIKIESK